MSCQQTTIAGGLLIGLCGCQTIGANDDVPARITDPTDASRAALQATVNVAMNTNVLLAEDALTGNSVLTIELTPPGTMANPVPDGRRMQMPVKFRLVMNNSDCILIDERNQSRYTLSNTTCEAE